MKILFFIAISAIVTLSFTFASFEIERKAELEQTTKDTTDPVGGFVAEDAI